MKHAEQVRLLEELFIRDPETVTRRAAAFGDIAEAEDYAVGVRTQKATRSGELDYVLFGHNELALQNFHNNFRAALSMPPLETL